MVGNLSEAWKSKRPPSTIAPPIRDAVAADPLVTECITRSAPKLDRPAEIGREGVVDQQRNAGSMGDVGDLRDVEHFEAGLPMVSAMTRRVLRRMAARKPPRSRGLTNVVAMPKRGSVWASRLMVPP